MRSAECGVQKNQKEIFNKIEIKAEFKSELSRIIKHVNKLEIEI